MSALMTLLTRLRQLDVKLELHQGNLKINAPQGALDDALKAELKENKQALIAFLTQAKHTQQGVIPKLSSEQKQQGVAATDSQARFWFLEKFSPGQNSFNIPFAVEIRGKLHIGILEKSIQYLIERHDSLRTAFEERDGKPFLKIHEHIDWQLDCEEIMAETEAALQETIFHEAQKTLAAPFDLNKAPLLRIKLLKVHDDSERYILLNCIHHIVCDGWSTDIILREMTAVYLAFSQGLASPLTKKQIDFSDYAAWFQHQDNQQVQQELLAYWQQQLKGAKGILPFPYDRPRPLNPSSRGSTFNFHVTERLSKTINEYCQRQGMTPFMFFMAAYQICLAKYCKSSDVSVGIPIAGRTRQDIEGIVGLFLNALVIRNQVQNDKALSAFLAEVKDCTLIAFDKQELALDTLIDNLEIDREQNEIPGVQFGFIFQNTREQGFGKSSSSFESEQLSVKPIEFQGQSAKHDICLSMSEGEKIFFATLEYKVSLLDEQSISDFSRHFICVLEQMVAMPASEAISKINLFSRVELCKALEVMEENCVAIRELTPSQMGFYLNDLIHVGNQSSLIGYSILIRGNFDIERWERVLQKLSDQRAVLRTQIFGSGQKKFDAAYQVVFKTQPIDFEIIDGKHLSISEAEERVRQIIYQPFVLERKALIRYRVLLLKEGRYMLITSMHHALLDAVSGFEHWVEAQEIYESGSSGEIIRDDSYLAYLDFAASAIDSTNVLQYWEGALDKVVAPDYSVHGATANEVAHKHGQRRLRRLMVEGEEWQKIKHYCRANGITPAILYKLVFGFLVEKYCQPESAFYINEIVTGRPKQFSKTLGNCFLIQPFIFLENSFSADTNLVHLFSLARQQQKAHKPFAFLSQQSLQKFSPPGRVGFFYNYLTFLPPGDFLGHPVDFRDWGNEIDQAVEFNPRLGPDGLELNLFYREGLFREENFLVSVQYLIAQMMSGCQKSSDLQMVPSPQQGAFLYQSALAVQGALPKNPHTVCDLLMQHAHTQPEKVAVKMGDNSLTYAQLNTQANQVANFLQEKNIRSGNLVILALDKSPWLLSCIVGVLKAGAQYLPLDTSLPEDRKNYIFENSQAKLLLTLQQQNEILACAETFTTQKISITSPAYTIYTSGSTGLPKGVQVSHRALLNTYYAWQDAFGLSAADRHLQMASVGFDVFTGDWVRSLCSGASLHLVSKDTLLEPEKLAALIELESITIAEFVPQVLRSLLQLKHSQKQKLGMRMLIVGSDAWHQSDQVLLGQCVEADTLLVNSYGITEAVIDSCWSVQVASTSAQQTADQKQMVSIGKPLANTALYVLDKNLKLLPKEISGELFIGGPDLADGYLYDEAKTAAAYLPDTIAGYLLENNHPARMYRSGDRAKLCENGELILLGRIGQQVKVRGFRIELGEIENQLSLLPEVEACAVLALDNPQTQQKTLVAYAVFRSGCELGSSEIRQRLVKYLPDYMLPSLVVALQKFPLNANGKIDRNALPAVDFSQNVLVEFLAARNPLEEKLCSIWQEVLGLEHIGVNDNFFDLGGHSLLATQIISRIKKGFSRDLPIKVIFELPTIAELANALAIALSRDDVLLAPDIVPVERKTLMPSSYAQKRFWFLDQLVPGFFAYNMPFGLRLTGAVDADALQMVLTEIYRRHESLRCNFVSAVADYAKGEAGQACEQQILVKVADALAFPLERIDLSHLVERDEQQFEKEVEKLLSLNAHKPFDLANDILLRCSLVKISQQEHLLLGCMHHIISDGWSVRILFRDIALLYNAFSQQRPSPLPELALQYLDYAAWEQSWLQGEVLERYTQFWLKQLQDAPEILSLPTDKQRPPVQTFNGKQIAIKKSLAFKQTLENFSKKHNASIFMTLMAAMSVLMSRYAGSKDILIGTPVAGRNQLASENIIGLFLNAIIIRSRLDDNPTVEQLLSQLRETCLAAFAHQDMPAEILFERLAKHRNPQFPAGVQVGLVLQNTASQQTRVDTRQFGQDLKNLRAELLGAEQVVSNYDFGLTVIEQDDGIEIIAEFNTDLFFDSSIERMLQQYVRILETMFTNPQMAVENIALADEKQLPDLLKLDSKQYKSVLPLTAMQQGMFLANKLNPLSKEYGVGFSVRMHQSVDRHLWIKALQGLVDTQDVCRVRFVESDVPWLDPVYQIIKKSTLAKVEYLDWTQDKKTEQEIEAVASQFINAPYNVLKDDLMRVLLIKVHENYFVGVFGAHHILLDGIAVVAFGVMGAMNYQLMQQGGAALIHEDKYQEYLHLDRSQVDNSETRTFWKTLLQNESLNLEALDYPVNPQALLDAKKSKKSLTLETQHWEAIKLYCKQQRITPALYFKALYVLLLSRYCRTENDFYIYEILAGRPVGHMNALGCYFQQLPLLLNKENFIADARVSDLFKALRQFQKTIKHKQNISVPLQNSLLPQGAVSFMYNFEHYIPDFYFMGEKVEIQEYSNQVNGFVQLLVKTLADTVQLNLQAQETFFDDFDLLERMVFVSQQILAGKDRVGELILLREEEKQKQLSYLAAARNLDSGSPPQCIHQLFEQQAARTATAIAVSDRQGSWDYQTLNEKANQLARYLLAQGVTAHDVVGICLPLCKEVPLALMAILKTGASYLPMDTQYPDERLHYFIEDAKPKLVLTLPYFFSRLSSAQTKHKLQLCSVQDESVFQFEKTNPDIPVNPKQLIYALYTSGSTGLPNCTASYHCNEHNLLDWYCGRFNMSTEDRLLVISAMGFDLTQKNLMAPLICGAQLVLHDSEVFNAKDILKDMEAFDITWLNCAPSAFYPLVENEQGEMNSLRWVFLGGESIAFERLKHWYKKSNSLLVNSYGPSECTDISAFYIVEKNHGQSSEMLIPIGKANDNVELFILDQYRQLLPFGLPGELFIGGAGLGAGYIHNAELQKRKFLDSDYSQGKLYKSGDIVRYLPDGNIHYIGRRDFQVKLNGVRIELGEVESRIKSLALVKDCVVVLKADDKQERLVAYLILQQEIKDESFALEEIERQSRLLLSARTLPSAYVCLQAFPLSPNGKIDRKALPEPKSRQKHYVAPQSNTEKQLANIWQDVLHLEQVGRYDNFFDVGGNSLLAVQLLSRINQTFDSDYPLAILFEAQSVDVLALKIDSSSRRQWQPMVTLQSGGSVNLFCVHPLGGEVLCYRDLARALGDDYSVYALQASGLVNGQRINNDLNVVVKTYTDEILKVQSSGIFYLCGQSLGGVLAIAIAEALQKENKKIAFVALFDSFVPSEKNLQMLGMEHLRAALGNFMHIDDKILASMTELEQLQTLFEQAKANYLIPRDIDFSQVKNRYLVAKANIQLAQSMQMKPLPFAIKHFEAEQSLSGLHSHSDWHTYAEHIDYFRVKGHHESIMQQANVVTIASALKKAIQDK